MSEGLYFSGATKAIRVYENVDDKTNNTNKYFTILPNTDHFIPIKDPTNLYLTAPDSTTTITVRGH